MATTSFSESFKYGSRLFGFYLAILLVGGGLVGAGGYLAVPEVEAWLATGSTETAMIAGGLVLGVVGFAVLVIGQFAMLYKLIADGVSRGNADPAVDLAVAPAESEDTDEADDEQEEAPAEQVAAAAGAADQEPEPEKPPADQIQEPAADTQPQESAPESQPHQATEGQSQPEPPEEAPTQPAAEAEQPDQPAEPAETGREQTAEEIVFGSGDDTDEEAADTEEDTGDFEFDEESESRENVETAGNPSSDPLADNFDDE